MALQKPSQDPEPGCKEAEPGTRILLSGGDHIPNQFIENLAGTESAPILIITIRIPGGIQKGVSFHTIIRLQICDSGECCG